jgi:hypothetical protein
VRLEPSPLRAENSIDQNSRKRVDSTALNACRFSLIMAAATTMSAAVAHLMELPAKMHYEPPLYVRLHRTLYPTFRKAARPAEAVAVASTSALAVPGARHHQVPRPPSRPTSCAAPPRRSRDVATNHTSCDLRDDRAASPAGRHQHSSTRVVSRGRPVRLAGPEARTDGRRIASERTVTSRAGLTRWNRS